MDMVGRESLLRNNLAVLVLKRSLIEIPAAPDQAYVIPTYASFCPSFSDLAVQKASCDYILYIVGLIFM